jgi:glycosyltransferase involved in cell wall biosynthesis
MNRFKVCHFASALGGLDSRLFHLECVPLAASGVDVCFVGPHGINGKHLGVQLLSSPVRRNRAVRMFTAPLLLGKLLRQRAVIYHFHNPELIPVGLVLKLLFRKRVVYDVWEDFPTTMRNKRYIPGPLRGVAKTAVCLAEGIAARCFDGVVTADPFTLRRFARKGGSRKIVFFNFPNLEFFPPPNRAEKRFDFVYRGGLSERAGTLVLLEAMRLTIDRGKRPRLLLVGYYDDERTRQLVECQISRTIPEELIEIHSKVPHETMAATLAEARVGVCPLLAVPKFLLNLPVKVWEYWACGLPVIATDLPPAKLFVRHGENGLLVPAGNASALASAFEWMMDHGEAASEMGANGRSGIVTRFNNAREVPRLISFYRTIMGISKC